jgi:hypothetical protein
MKCMHYKGVGVMAVNLPRSVLTCRVLTLTLITLTWVATHIIHCGPPPYRWFGSIPTQPVLGLRSSIANHELCRPYPPRCTG